MHQRRSVSRVAEGGRLFGLRVAGRGGGERGCAARVACPGCLAILAIVMEWEPRYIAVRAAASRSLLRREHFGVQASSQSVARLFTTWSGWSTGVL